MQKTAPSISADKKVLHLHCPKAWGEMSQEQLRYTLTLIGCNLYNDVEIRTYMLFRFCGIKVLKKHHGSVSCRVRLGNGRWHFFDLQAWQVQDMIGQLKGRDNGDMVLIPKTMLRSGEDVFLDDLHVPDAEKALGVPFYASDCDGESLVRALLGKEKKTPGRLFRPYEPEENES